MAEQPPELVVVLRSRRRYVATPVDVPDLAWERVAADLTRRYARRTRQRIPGEHDLAAQYGVSRATIRRALTHLADEDRAWPVPRVGWYMGSRRA